MPAALATNTKLGRFFSLGEFTRSRTAAQRGLNNMPNAQQQRAMKNLVARVLDPLRADLGRPVRITSGFRSSAVNAAVGGASRSLHTTGEAVDIKVNGFTAQQLAARVRRLKLPASELIPYAESKGGHLHVGLRA